MRIVSGDDDTAITNNEDENNTADNSEESHDESVLNVGSESKLNHVKFKNKKGIIYISSIPKYMNVTQLRELMQQFGEVGRIYLQPADSKNKKKKQRMKFTEGWVEFKKKRIAKQVALSLNSKQVDVRKRSKLYDYIWNIKYLSRFKWIHLSERLAYEKAVHKQRMRAEIAQAKKEATHFSLQVGNKAKKYKMKQNSKQPTVQQRKPGNDTSAECEDSKYKETTEGDRAGFLKSLFA